MKKQDRRISKTRKSILDAFYNLTTEKSIEEITIKEITERADINRATFYYHFFDKEQLLMVLLEEQLLNDWKQSIKEYTVFNEECFQKIVKGMMDAQRKLYDTCTESYAVYLPNIEKIMIENVYEHLITILPNDDEKNKHIQASYISWGIFGLAKTHMNTLEVDVTLFTETVKKSTFG